MPLYIYRPARRTHIQISLCLTIMHSCMLHTTSWVTTYPWSKQESNPWCVIMMCDLRELQEICNACLTAYHPRILMQMWFDSLYPVSCTITDFVSKEEQGGIFCFYFSKWKMCMHVSLSWTRKYCDIRATPAGWLNGLPSLYLLGRCKNLISNRGSKCATILVGLPNFSPHLSNLVALYLG